MQRRRTAQARQAHVLVSINQTNGGLVAVHEVGLVVALLVGGLDGRGQPDLQRVVGASPQGERRLAVLLDDHALPNVGYPTTIRT